MRSIAFLITLMEKDNPTKASFFKGFLNILPNFTPRVVETKILPPLLNELKNDVQLPFVLPIVLEISNQFTPREFTKIIFPHLIPLFSVQNLQKFQQASAIIAPTLPLIMSRLNEENINKRLFFLFNIYLSSIILYLTFIYLFDYFILFVLICLIYFI